MGHAVRWLQRYWWFRYFKNTDKKWKIENCPCRLYKTYINNKGFVGERKERGENSNSIFGIVAIACQYRFATNKYMLLFYLFNQLFIAYWWICLISRFLYLYRNQSINFLVTITWLVSVWSVGVLRVWDSMGTLVRYELLIFQ